MNINTANFLFFIAASFVLIITPGPNLIYVITRGISQGRTAALFSAMGVATGDLVHAIAAALGLAVILQTSSIAYLVIKVFGAIYLLYLGIRCLFDKQGMFQAEVLHNKSNRSLIFQGFLTAVLNPKTALFFISFLPQFIDSKSSSPGLQTLIFGLSFVSMGLIMLIITAILSGQLGNWLMNKEKVRTFIKWATASIFIALGIRLALPKN